MENPDEVQWDLWMADEVLDDWAREDKEAQILDNSLIAGAGSHDQSSRLPEHTKVEAQAGNASFIAENDSVHAPLKYAQESSAKDAQPDLLPEHTFEQMMADEMNSFDKVEEIYKRDREFNALSLHSSQNSTDLHGPSKAVDHLMSSPKPQGGIAQGGAQSMDDAVNPLILPQLYNSGSGKVPVKSQQLQRGNGSRVIDEATNPKLPHAQQYDEGNAKQVESHLESEVSKPQAAQKQLQQGNDSNATPARSLALNMSELSELLLSRKRNDNNAVQTAVRLLNKTREAELQQCQHIKSNPGSTRSIALDVHKTRGRGTTSESGDVARQKGSNNPNPTEGNRQLTAPDRKRKASDESLKCHQPTPCRPYKPINLQEDVNIQRHSGFTMSSTASPAVRHKVDARGHGVIQPDLGANPNQVQQSSIITQQQSRSSQDNLPAPQHVRTGLHGGTPPELVNTIPPHEIQTKYGSSMSPDQQKSMTGEVPNGFPNHHHQPASQKVQSTPGSMRTNPAHHSPTSIYLSSSPSLRPQMDITGGMLQGVPNYHNQPAQQKSQTAHYPPVSQSQSRRVAVVVPQHIVSHPLSQPMGPGSNLKSALSFSSGWVCHPREHNVSFNDSQPPVQQMPSGNHQPSQSGTDNHPYIATQQSQMRYTQSSSHQYQNLLNHNIQNQDNSSMTFLNSGPGIPNNLSIQRYPRFQPPDQAATPQGQQAAFMSPRLTSCHGGGNPGSKGKSKAPGAS